MDYDEDYVLEVLMNLKNDSGRIVYTEHFLDDLEKRNIIDTQVEELLQFRRPLKINNVSDNRFELCYSLDAFHDLSIIADIFNRNKVILISAVPRIIRKSEEKNRVIRLEKIYDEAFDLMNLCIGDGFSYGQSVEMDEGFYIDFDTHGQPFSIELLQASKKFNLKGKFLSSAKLKGVIIITDDLIKVSLEANVNISSIDSRFAEKETGNVYGISPDEYELKILNISVV